MELVGRQFGPYTILGRLGAGGMGEVHLARDTRLEREVAIKVLPLAVSADPEHLARFRREALALAALNHPNIATLYGFEPLGNGAMALVLERVEGESLAERLERGAPAPAEALRVCGRIAEALEVAHERGIVHRDLKPANVMLGPRGIVKVLDFGIAKRAGPPGSGAVATAGEGDAGSDAGDEEVVGTPGYMSPEQVMGLAHDHRADVFAFGCVLYETLTGVPAFPGADGMERMSAAMYAEPEAERLPSGLAPAISALIARCLEKQPEQRLGAMEAAGTAIEEALGARPAPSEAGPRAVPHNLPQAGTTFVGREREIAAGLERLAHARLLTLTGVGGCGKTRLALRLAVGSLEAHPDGVWFVDLAPQAADARVPEVLAEKLGVREEAGRTVVQSLVNHLASRTALLVLDNCEHLVEACAALAARLLEACPGVRVLATSREPLGVSGEVVYAVPTLAVPARGERPEAILANESVRLFVERAGLARPAFALAEADTPAVAEICRRLDGIPLALELAAARVKLLTVEQIRDRLDDRFRLLTGGSRTALPRQQTLRATLQWSYDQLLPEEQRLLGRLGVFAGGWTFGQALAVCEADADEFELLDRLGRLVDKSLVVIAREGHAEPRYRLLESVRQYALERLTEDDGAAAVRARHLGAFLELAEEAERHASGPRQAEWFRRLDLEEENLLAALEWSTHVADGASLGLRLAAAAYRFWSSRGNYEVGRRALEEALARDTAAAPTPERAVALVRAGAMALYQGDPAAARPRIEASLAIERVLGNTHGIARALQGLATVALYQEDYAGAQPILEESLELYRRTGQTARLGTALYNLGYVAGCLGDHATARARYEEAMAGLLESGDRRQLALTLAGLAAACARLGDLPVARMQVAAALGLALELGARREGADAIEAVADLARHTGHLEAAARLYGAEEGLREAIASPPAPADQRRHDRSIAELRAQLDPAAMAAATASGRALGFEAAIGQALQWLGESDRG